MGDINFSVFKEVNLNKQVTLDVDKNVNVDVDNNDILATAEADAEAFGRENALAEVDTYTFVNFNPETEQYEAFAYAESTAAIDIIVLPPSPGSNIIGTLDDDLIIPGFVSEGVTGGNPGPGPDTIQGLGSNDFLDGGGGNDSLLGGHGADSIRGGTGDDILKGEGDDDALDGDSGNDTLLGGNGADSVFGDLGDDSLEGNAGNDTLDGFSGNDELFGGSEADTLVGSNGNDTLIGGTGDDLLIGGSDPEESLAFIPPDGRRDIFKFELRPEIPEATSGFGNDTIRDFGERGTGKRDKIEFGFRIIAVPDDSPRETIVNLDVLDDNSTDQIRSTRKVSDNDTLVSLDGDELVITLPDSGTRVTFQDGITRTITYSFDDRGRDVFPFDGSTIRLENSVTFGSALNFNISTDEGDFIFVGSSV